MLHVHAPIVRPREYIWLTSVQILPVFSLSQRSYIISEIFTIIADCGTSVFAALTAFLGAASFITGEGFNTGAGNMALLLTGSLFAET